MKSDLFRVAAVFIYNNVFLIAAILIALVVLNFVRVRMVAMRKRRQQMRRQTAKSVDPMWAMLEKL